MKKMHSTYPALIISCLLLGACGGGGGSSGKSPGGADDGGGKDDGGNQQARTGVFLDSPVAGIGYRTETKSGVTNALGEYEYLPGESVRFYIGDLELPPVSAKGVVTPRDIAQGNTTTETNILQLLQSLDADNDPSNGISIPQNASAAFTGVSLNLTSAAFDAEVTPLLNQLGKTLVSEDEANKHFDQALRAQLLGSWLYSEGTGKRNVLTFIDDKHYIIIHEHDDEPGEPGSQRAGSAEYGTYTWQTSNGAFNVNLIRESDGWGGLYDEGSSVTSATLDADALTFPDVDGGSVTFTRVINPGNPLVGAWSLYEADDDNLNVLTFLSDSQYAIVHTNNQESYEGAPQALSGEFGTYSLNNSVFKALGASVDTDGPGGLFNREDESDQAGESIQIHPWGDLSFIDQDEGTFSFMRIGGFRVELQDLDASGSLGSISAIRDSSGFSEDELVDSHHRMKVDFADGGNSSFELMLKAQGTGVLTETSEDFSADVEWFVNTTGAIVATFSDGEERFTMTIAKILGARDNEAPKVLLSLQSSAGEDSLWETRFEPVEAK